MTYAVLVLHNLNPLTEYCGWIFATCLPDSGLTGWRGRGQCAHRRTFPSQLKPTTLFFPRISGIVMNDQSSQHLLCALIFGPRQYPPCRHHSAYRAVRLVVSQPSRTYTPDIVRNRKLVVYSHPLTDNFLQPHSVFQPPSTAFRSHGG